MIDNILYQANKIKESLSVKTKQVLCCKTINDKQLEGVINIFRDFATNRWLGGWNAYSYVQWISMCTFGYYPCTLIVKKSGLTALCLINKTCVHFDIIHAQ